MMNRAEKSDKELANDDNPFAAMGLIKFWVVAYLFFLTFPISLGVCYVALGSRRTRQLISALLHDFLQTVLIFLLAVVLLFGSAWYVISTFFVG